MSRQELADLANRYLTTPIDPRYVARLERGVHWWPNRATREALRQALDVATDAELGFHSARAPRRDRVGAAVDNDQNATTHSALPANREDADMNRREMLRLLGTTSVLLSVSNEGIDWDRVNGLTASDRPVDQASVADLMRVNEQLWKAFARAETKKELTPLVISHLRDLTSYLRRGGPERVQTGLSAAAADLYQLAGELAFDDGRHADAAYCYSVAVSASRQARAYDLWACAITRHAFIDVFGRDFGQAEASLKIAGAVARRGDTALSVRYWVEAVRAQALAGLGDREGCMRALDAAAEVHLLSGAVHNGGWLRFDGARLDEERGTCYVALAQPDLAEPVLQAALAQRLSTRRRGAVFTDLAIVAAQRGDVHGAVMHGGAALGIARFSGSGVVATKLARLRTELADLRHDGHVRHLDAQIAGLTSKAA